VVEVITWGCRFFWLHGLVFAFGYLPYLNHPDASDLATWNQERQAETMVSEIDRLFKCFKLTEEQESPHEHQQNLLLSRIITNVV
jgi:hypothetical protein